MADIYFVPNWFLGYDMLFELAFAIIALIVALYAFKIYKLSGQKQSRLFGISFLFVSLSYFLQSLLNFLIVTKLNTNVCQALRISSVELLNTFGIYMHIIFFLAGLVILTYMTLKIRSPKTLSLLFILTFLFLLLGSNRHYLFYVLSSILFIYIVIHYLVNYLKQKHYNTLLVLVAFIFLLFGSIHFIFSVNHGLYYVIGHFLEFFAYLLILINLILVVKK
jgi:hypothetical protein